MKKMKRDVIAVNLGIRQAGNPAVPAFHKSHTYKLKEMEIYGISESFIKEQTKKAAKRIYDRCKTEYKLYQGQDQRIRR